MQTGCKKKYFLHLWQDRGFKTWRENSGTVQIIKAQYYNNFSFLSSVSWNAEELSFWQGLFEKIERIYD